VHLANTLLIDKETARDSHVLACTFANYLPIQKNSRSVGYSNRFERLADILQTFHRQKQWSHAEHVSGAEITNRLLDSGSIERLD